mmetsp:Transcript_9381/g.17947  ORF Transcript_9381/g.17947 Transcript_9381/m.17947 type:complete len:448 (+) Transcript_9381:189-1532(+)
MKPSSPSTRSATVARRQQRRNRKAAGVDTLLASPDLENDVDTLPPGLEIMHAPGSSFGCDSMMIEDILHNIERASRGFDFKLDCIQKAACAKEDPEQGPTEIGTFRSHNSENSLHQLGCVLVALRDSYAASPPGMANPILAWCSVQPVGESNATGSAAADAGIESNGTESNAIGSASAGAGIESNSIESNATESSATDSDIGSNGAESIAIGSAAAGVGMESNSIECNATESSATDADIGSNGTESNATGSAAAGAGIENIGIGSNATGSSATDADVGSNGTESNAVGSAATGAGVESNGTEINVDAMSTELSYMFEVSAHVGVQTDNGCVTDKREDKKGSAHVWEDGRTGDKSARADDEGTHSQTSQWKLTGVGSSRQWSSPTTSLPLDHSTSQWHGSPKQFGLYNVGGLLVFRRGFMPYCTPPCLQLPPAENGKMQNWTVQRHWH